MIITDYENSCWENNDNISRASLLLRHPMQQNENLLNGRDNIDYFNVNTVRSVERSAINVMPEQQQPSQQQQQQQEQQPVPLPVSHFSSNGYYGYSLICKNDNEICGNSTNATNNSNGVTVPSASTTFSSNEICTDNIEDQQHHHQPSIERRKRQYNNNSNNQSCFKRLRFENNEHQMEHEDSPMTNAMNCNGCVSNITESLNIIPSTATLNVNGNYFIRAYNSYSYNTENNIHELNNNNCDVNVKNNSPSTNFCDSDPTSNQLEMENLYWHLHGGVGWHQ